MKLVLTSVMVVIGLKILAMMFVQCLWTFSISRDLETVLWGVAGALVIVGWVVCAEWVRTR